MENDFSLNLGIFSLYSAWFWDLQGLWDKMSFDRKDGSKEQEGLLLVHIRDVKISKKSQKNPT